MPMDVVSASALFTDGRLASVAMRPAISREDDGCNRVRKPPHCAGFVRTRKSVEALHYIAWSAQSILNAITDSQQRRRPMPGVIDADTHIIEPGAMWDEFPAELYDRAAGAAQGTQRHLVQGIQRLLADRRQHRPEVGRQGQCVSEQPVRHGRSGGPHGHRAAGARVYRPGAASA